MATKSAMRGRVDAQQWARQPQWYRDAYWALQEPVLNRMWPTSRNAPRTAPAQPQTRLLNDVERGAVSPLGGVSRPASETR
jgi:hypothetical protein